MCSSMQEAICKIYTRSSVSVMQTNTRMEASDLDEVSSMLSQRLESAVRSTVSYLHVSPIIFDEDLKMRLEQ